MDDHLTLLANYNPEEWPSLNTILKAVFPEKYYGPFNREKSIKGVLHGTELDSIKE